MESYGYCYGKEEDEKNVMDEVEIFTELIQKEDNVIRLEAAMQEWKSKGNNGWTFKKYAELLIRYRNSIENKEVRMPIIILARTPNEDHQIEWISNEFISELTISD